MYRIPFLYAAASFLLQMLRPCYASDGMRLWGKSTAFLKDPAFRKAYKAGMAAQDGFRRFPKFEWRMYTCCWAASHARLLEGDFVECGVNRGVISVAVCNYIDFNATGKNFFLFDTFNGIPEAQMMQSERADRVAENAEFYEECYAQAQRNFSPFPKAQLIRGQVPETLGTVAIGKVCYLSIDMNIAVPEIAAIEYFWDKLVTGAVVVLDDYGFTNRPEQKKAMDAFAARKGVMIYTIPTGQGLLLKP